jgi:hypothetical protein
VAGTNVSPNFFRSWVCSKWSGVDNFGERSHVDYIAPIATNDNYIEADFEALLAVNDLFSGLLQLGIGLVRRLVLKNVG